MGLITMQQPALFLRKAVNVERHFAGKYPKGLIVTEGVCDVHWDFYTKIWRITDRRTLRTTKFCNQRDALLHVRECNRTI